MFYKKKDMIHQQELLEEILSRLPAKSIGRFRTVSKSWKSLLSQPHFIKDHLKQIKQYPVQEKSIILQCDVTGSLYTAQLRYAHQVFDEMTAFATELMCENCYTFYTDNCLETLASSDRLCTTNNGNGSFSLINIITRESKELPFNVNFLSSMTSCDGLVVVKDADENLVLINPTTRKHKEVPASPYATDPRYSKTMFGIGYDSVVDDYKVVTISYYDDNYYVEADDMNQSDRTEMFVGVYSARNGTWKRGLSSPYNHAAGFRTPGIFVDGRIHWLASLKAGLSFVIVAFDVEQETYHEVPPPSSLDPDMFVFHRLVALGGCLCLFRFNQSYQTDIWVMNEYGVKESWTKFTIEDSEKSEYRPLCLLGKEQVVLVKDEEYESPKLLMYNKEAGTSKEIVIQGIPYAGFDFGGAFLESLVSPHCNDEATLQG